MKNKMIALAVTAAISAPMLAQAEDPSVYGRLHLSYGNVEDTSANTDNWKVRSHGSRLGFKGSRDFGDGLKGIYKVEFEVNPDSDGSDDDGIKRRNQYVGLQGSWGEVRFGRHDTPLKMSQGKFDLFGDTDGDLKNAGSQDGENRLDNILLYKNKSGNMSYAIAIAPGEGNGTTAGDGPGDTVSVSVSYKADGMYIALAQDSYDDTGAASGTENELTRLIGTYKTGDMQFGLMYQSGVEGVTASTNEEDWLGFSFSQKIGAKDKFKLQYITTEDNAATVQENTLLAVGFDHKFDKKTTGYVMYSSLEEETGATTAETNFIGVGMNLKF